MRDSMKITRDFIRDKCKIREPVAIQRAHRIPTRRTNDAKNPRPMIALFLENNDKMMVKEAVKKLPKDSGFRAYDDLPKPIHEARQRLNDDDVKHRRAGRDAWVIFPAKLIVDGDFVREEPVIPRQNPRAERRQRSPRREQPVSRDYSRGNRGERRQASPRPANRHNSDQSANAWQDPPHRRRGYGSRRGRGETCASLLVPPVVPELSNEKTFNMSPLSLAFSAHCAARHSAPSLASLAFSTHCAARRSALSFTLLAFSYICY